MKRMLSMIVAGVVAGVFLSFGGCAGGSGGSTGSESSVAGVWKEMGCNMGFAIDGLNFIEYMSVPPVATKTFAGVIVNNPDLTAESGLIVVRITDVGMSAMYGAAVGTYTVARWKSFAGDKAGQTYAKDASNKPIFYATEAEANALTEASPELNRFCCQVSNRM